MDLQNTYILLLCFVQKESHIFYALLFSPNGFDAPSSDAFLAAYE